MSKLTKNISRHEIACECGCGYDTIDFTVVNLVQKYADYLLARYRSKVVVDIGRGTSCVEHNETVQLKANPNYKPYTSKSTHLIAKAMDVKFYVFIRNKKTQIPPREVNEYFDKKYPNSLGLGVYTWGNHIDSRDLKARWNSTTK